MMISIFWDVTPCRLVDISFQKKVRPPFSELKGKPSVKKNGIDVDSQYKSSE
jgi:hypothetical protein